MGKARYVLKKIMVDVSRVLHYLIRNNSIPISDAFRENEDVLNRLLENSLAELQINYDGDSVEEKLRIASILFEIDRLDEKSLESVGLIGNNLVLKAYVYENVVDDLNRLVRGDEISYENKS
jgi:hypothetical protein